jgi:hypothetical protein
LLSCWPPDAVTHTHTHTHGIRAGNDTALTRDMLGLLDDPDISDLTLIVEGRKIYVHRALLFARSAHFKNMFSSGNSTERFS